MNLKKYKCVDQHDAADCGAAALATVCQHYGLEISITKIRDVVGTDIKGTNLKGIVEGAIKSNRKKLIKTVERQLYRRIGSVALGYASTAVNIALTVGGTSIGGLIAEGFDRADGKNDGYLFA